MNKFINYLNSLSPTCGAEYCSTCGGVKFFLKRMYEQNFDITESLLDISDTDIATLMKYKKYNNVAYLLNDLSDTKRKILYEYWKNKKSDFEIILEYKSQESLKRKKDILEEFRNIKDISYTKYSNKLYTRDILNFIFGEAILIDEAIKRVIEAEKLKIRQEKDEKLDNTYKAISKMPFIQRVNKILNDDKLNNRDLWHYSFLNKYKNILVCTVEEVELLDASEVQYLIDICEDDYTLNKNTNILYDRRYQLSIQEMENIRNRYKGLQKKELLKKLIEEKKYKIENYPIELAKEIDANFFFSLSDENKIYFLNLISKTRMRTWTNSWKKIVLEINKYIN